MFTLAICTILMAIHKLFSKILLIQTYHTTCVSFSSQFNTHPKHMILWRTYDNQGKNSVLFCKNFMSTETFT